MPFTIEAEPEEELLFSDTLGLEKVTPFAFAVSDRAIYLPRRKRIAVSDPHYFERVPHTQVRAVRLSAPPPYAMWLVAVVLIAVGGLLSYWMLDSEYEGRASGYPFGLIAVGIVLPFVLRGRRALEVETDGSRFRWKSPLVLGKTARQRIRDIQDEIVEACRSVGLPVDTTMSQR